jgi:hypothetical protein
VAKDARFHGVLVEPIAVNLRHTATLTDTPEGRAETQSQNANEMLRALTETLEKLPALFKHYGIEWVEGEPPPYVLLVLAMAREFVPGFRIKNLAIEKGRGRKQVWDFVKYSMLLADVQTLRKRGAASDSEACAQLVKLPRYASRWNAYSKRTLENRLLEARDPEKNIMIKIGGAIEAKGLLPNNAFPDIFRDSFSITENE